MTSGLILILFAPFAGSFLAVLADRLPRGEDAVLGRSRCRSCGARLQARDLVPVVSFALSRGRCRRCGGAIPPWLLYCEIAATGLAVLAVIATPTALQAWGNALFLWVLLALALADATRFRLPDLLTGALFLVALWLAMLPGGIGLRAAVAGAVAGAGSFWLIRIAYQHLRGREGLGLGDVKLMAGLGAFSGVLDLPVLVLIAALGGLVVALLLLRRRAEAPGRKPLGQTALPFGAALCGAGAILWFARVLLTPSL